MRTFIKSVFVCCAFALLAGLTSCDNGADGGTGTGAWSAGFRQNEEAIGSAVGYHPPGQVSVTMRLDNGFIRIVDIDVQHETLQIVGVNQRPNSIRNVIEQRNSFDGIRTVDVHGASGATVTFNAILNAGREALESLRDD
ncbi:MAG: FMN-binding protein [Treponema sp.]|nr:FMN-binding protein [Treponema sp.]